MRKVLGALPLFLVSLFASTGFGAGLEHPDNGAIAVGRAGAYAANPEGAVALQYNPAGFASFPQGWTVALEAKLVDQNIRYTDTNNASVENQAPLFLAPGGVVAYNFGEVGPFSSVTWALGALGPSAVGKVSYDPEGPQRYALIDSNYFIAFASSAVAFSISDWFQAGLTFQLAAGSAKFSKKAYAGSKAGYDPRFDALATVDVSGAAPTAVLGVTVKPVKGLAIGASFRPSFTWKGEGTLTTELPASSSWIDAQREGDAALLSFNFPTVARFGVAYDILDSLTAEADFVYEGWSSMQSVDVVPQGITVTSALMDGVKKPLDNIKIDRRYTDAWSARIGLDYRVIPERLVLRTGYVYETSAIPDITIGVDNANWGRQGLGVGASVKLFGAWLDVAYGHHFIPTQEVTESVITQTVTPCLLGQDCKNTEASSIGNGTYEGSFDIFAVAIRVPFSGLESHI